MSVADAWNSLYPVGTPVLAFPDTRSDEGIVTKTRSEAWTLGHGAAVVSVEGYAGGIALTHVDVICAARCPVHEHVCQRSPHPLLSELDIKSPGAWDPHCRDRRDSIADCCTWDRERNGLLVGHRGQLDILRAAVARDGGEWTPGRVKRLFHRDARLTHVLRVTIRRHLARLHAEGFLTLHEEPGRRFYTRTEAAR